MVGVGFAHDFDYEGEGAGKWLAEHPVLIAALKESEGDSWGGADEVLLAEARERWGERAADRLDWILTTTDPQQLLIVAVTGPYRITEYDGAEGIETLDEVLQSYW